MTKAMKLAVLTVCCTLQLHLVSAQSAEIQQLALNIEKLAQFKQILRDMKAGYDIIFKGYNTIKDISEGNFSLHKVFLDGLLAVNPQLARYGRVADIIRYQGYILDEYNTSYNRMVGGGRFTRAELDYISGIYRNLFAGSLRNLDELAMVLTASELRMSDDERLTAIDRLYADMESKLVFIRRFNRRASMLDTQRAKAQQEQMLLEQLYEGY